MATNGKHGAVSIALLVALFGALLMSACNQKRKEGGMVARQGPTMEAAGRTNVISGPVVLRVSDTSVRIVWSSNVVTDSRLRYGTHPDKLDQVADEPWGGSTHRVWLKNLAPNTTYYYRIGDSTARGSAADEVATFRTQPEEVQDPGGPKRAVTSGAGRQ
jgi:hypothetical protein